MKIPQINWRDLVFHLNLSQDARTSGSLLRSDKQYDEFKFKLTFQLHATTMPKTLQEI